MSENQHYTGGCLCGSVRYRVAGSMRNVIACHCHQCRRMTGHFLAASAAKLDEFQLVSDENLKWFSASDYAKRGFCGACGSTLFWQSNAADSVSICAGSLDDSKALKLSAHIFIEDAGSYYELDDNLPRFPGESKGDYW